MSADGDLWPSAVSGYLGALGSGDRATALGVVRRLRAGGHGILEIIKNVLTPAQLQVGSYWVEDVWSVAQEHAATAITEVVLNTLAFELESGSTAGPPSGPKVVVSCVEQEWHALPALMVSEYLRADGFSVSYLGANASAQHLVRHIHDVGPDAVLLSCSLSALLPVVRRQIEAVRETGTPVVVGGAGFDIDGRRAATLGATSYAPSGAAATAVVGALPPAVSKAEPLTHPGAAEAYVIFGDREGLADEVERTLLQQLAHEAHQAPTGDDPWLHVLDDQMPHLVGAVAGALLAADPTIVSDSMNWVETVLENRFAPPEVGRALRQALWETLSDLPVAASLLADVQPAAR